MIPFRWGVFGSGAISAKFSAGLRHIDADVRLVVSRGAHGRALASAFGAELVEGYAAGAKAAASGVDAVYIATPPAFHEEHACACIDAGVPVLIEKPFAGDAAAAARIAALARARGVFCMEAMWTRFMPAMQRLHELVRQGAIGEPMMMTGSFGATNVVDVANGNFDPARGGGALAHLGYYPVSLGAWLFGDAVEARAVGRVGTTGVDETVAIALRYPSGVVGSFYTSLRSPASNTLTVHGAHGALSLRGPIYRPWGLERRITAPQSRATANVSRFALWKEGDLYQRISRIREQIKRPGRVERLPFAGNGYHYEALEVAACVRAGALESRVMPLAETLAVTGLIDSLRKQVMEGPAL